VPVPRPLQAFDPAQVIPADPVTQAVGSFLLTVVVGGYVVYSRGGRLDTAARASMSAPLRSVVYGLLAFALSGFLLGYALTQLGQLGVPAGALVVAGVAGLGLFVAVFGGVGFAVVGVWATGTLGLRDPFLGLVGVGAVGAVVWVALPAVAAAAVWIAIGAVGIGGPTRLWFHSDPARADR
jgi:hypothetical protein